MGIRRAFQVAYGVGFSRGFTRVYMFLIGCFMEGFFRGVQVSC